MEEFVRGDWAAALPKLFALLGTLECQHAKGVESATNNERTEISVTYHNRCCECFSHVIVTTQLLALNRREQQIKDFLVNWYGCLQSIPAFVLSTWLMTSLEITNARVVDDELSQHDLDKPRNGDASDASSDILKIVVDWIEARGRNTPTPNDTDDTKDVTQLVELYCTKILEPTQGITATTVFVNDCGALSQMNREKVLLTLEQQNSQLLLEKILEKSASSSLKSGFTDPTQHLLSSKHLIASTPEESRETINQHGSSSGTPTNNGGSNSSSTWALTSEAVMEMFYRRLEKLNRIAKWIWIILQSGLRNRDPGIVARNIAVAMATIIALVTSLTVLIRRSRGFLSSEKSKTMLSELGWAAEQFFSGLI
eukprot:m.206787 g.206787  ORF g.206787 m.206787 type:complete len:369 (+) comp32968_c0_seq1:262-1368(+)